MRSRVTWATVSAAMIAATMINAGFVSLNAYAAAIAAVLQRSPARSALPRRFGASQRSIAAGINHLHNASHSDTRSQQILWQEAQAVPSSVLSHPLELETRLREQGFQPAKQLNLATTPEAYAAALSLAKEAGILLSCHVLAGAGDFSFNLACYYAASLWPAAQHYSVDTIADLFEHAGKRPPRDFLTAAFDARDDRRLTDEGLTIEVIFPEAEPDQDFDVVWVRLSRPLSQAEWQAWLSTGPMAVASQLQIEDNEQMKAICRRLLNLGDHPLARQSLELQPFGSSDVAGVRTAIFSAPDGESLWLRMRAGEEASLSIVHPNGTLEEL